MLYFDHMAPPLLAAASAGAWIPSFPCDLHACHHQAAPRALVTCYPKNRQPVPRCPKSDDGVCGLLLLPLLSGPAFSSPADLPTPAHHETGQHCRASCPAEPWQPLPPLEEFLAEFQVLLPQWLLAWLDPAPCGMLQPEVCSSPEKLGGEGKVLLLSAGMWLFLPYQISPARSPAPDRCA